MVRVAWVVLLLAGCMVPIGGDLTNKTRYAAEKKAARQLEPVPVAEPRSYATAPRRLKLRIWVDRGYQRRVHWREHVAEVVRRINAYLGPAFGIALDAELRDWPRGGEPETLDKVLDALRARDDGADVDHVVGLTGSLSFASMSHHELGLAARPGKHFVVRAMNGAEELRLLEKAYPTLDKKDRLALLERRNAHKEVVVFVHEWAHNYGALHDDGFPSIMGPSYDNLAGSMSESNAQIVAGGLAGEPAPPDVPLPEERTAFGTLSQIESRAARGERVQALQDLDSLAAGIPDGEARRWLELGQVYERIGAFTRADDALARSGNQAAREQAVVHRRERGLHDLPAEREPEASALVEAAHQSLVDEAPDQTLRLVEAALKQFPDLPGLLALKCGGLLYKGKRGPAEKYCHAAIAGWPETVYAHLFLGELHRQAGRVPAAIASLERARALDPDLQLVYGLLHALYQQTGDFGRARAVRSAHLARFGRSLD